ncbi:MAG: hypothetical protein COA74_14990 [Gammaproteobacteria bacterium]|nr:MAG: hypothetical protein COA74_14990 [Gammaproteobacteria bacterium]
MKKNILLILMLSLTACISTSQVNERLGAWDNVTLSDLINSWGVPTKEQEIASRKFYVWNNKNNDSSPTIGVSLGSHGGRGGISISSLFGGETEENICSRVVEVDAEDNILSITWTGKPSLCYELTPEKLTD